MDELKNKQLELERAAMESNWKWPFFFFIGWVLWDVFQGFWRGIH